MPPLKKQASPAPAPRAAALSQSASRFSAGATSAWQTIVGNSPRLAAAGPRQPGAARAAAPLSPPPGTSRVALEPQRLAEQIAPAAAPETMRQVGWREVDRAVGMSTKRKYSVFGVGFGPKVPVFETEKVKLPVYQETDRNKRYYAAVKAEDVDRVKREGFQPKLASSADATPQTTKQFNAQGHIHCFSSEIAARRYSQANSITKYVIIEFVLPEYWNFSDAENNPKNEATANLDKTQFISTEDIPAACIKSVKA